MHRTLYRTYRPQRLADLVGQDQAASLLRVAASTGRLGHAYLLYGSRGTGKTTTARILAKLFNCERRETDAAFRSEGDACNECGRCNEIERGSSLDVIEIDAASNRGIDEIRSLRESIRAVPTGSPYKVYIVDEAHMLTGAAWNALLKTLEEPPKHGVIILATTEYDKLPATIVSRTQRFLFRKPTKAVVLEKLKQIVKAEGMRIDDDALELIAAASDGSFRDAESLLEQARSLASGGASVTSGDVAALVGRIGLARVHALASFIVAKRTGDALAYLGELERDGANVTELTKDLIHYLRRALALSADTTLADVYADDLTAEELAKLHELAAQLNVPVGVGILTKLIAAYGEMRYSPLASIPLEVAIAELCAQ